MRKAGPKASASRACYFTYNLRAGPTLDPQTPVIVAVLGR